MQTFFGYLKHFMFLVKIFYLISCVFLSTVFLKYVGTDTICKWLHFKNVLLCKEVSQVTYVAACHKVCQLENALND